VILEHREEHMNVERQGDHLIIGGFRGISGGDDGSSPAAPGGSPLDFGNPIPRGDTVGALARPDSSNAAGTPPPTGWDGILSQLQSILGEIVQMIGGVFGSANYASATGSSTGDPHLAFSGTTSAGAQQTARVDNMQSQSDLLDSDSFAGGFQIATQATAPGANGITFNQSATIATNGGATQVGLDNAGNATVSQYGETTMLSNGQTLDLGGDETVTRAANGSLTIDDDNGQGGQIATTLSENGSGVDISAQATNVDLGGYLAGLQSA
jgi:hypothetical protein